MFELSWQKDDRVKNNWDLSVKKYPVLGIFPQMNSTLLNIQIDYQQIKHNLNISPSDFTDHLFKSFDLAYICNTLAEGQKETESWVSG